MEIDKELSDMMRSMTGFGRASVATPLGRFNVEIQSLNRKHLEVNTILPKELWRFDADIRKWIADAFSRGSITVRLSVTFENHSPVMILPNKGLAQQLKAASSQLSEELGISAAEITKGLLAAVPDLLVFGENAQEEEEYKNAVAQVLHEAIAGCLDHKRTEGLSLQNDILSRLSNLRKAIDQIASLAGNTVEKYRKKIQERLQELLPGNLENEERLLREVCLYAERVDISEEITRFSSHLQQIETLLHSDTTSVGKTMEFFLQELQREINTIGSKASDVEISRIVVESKSELERIREQIQNVE